MLNNMDNKLRRRKTEKKGKNLPKDTKYGIIENSGALF